MRWEFRPVSGTTDKTKDTFIGLSIHHTGLLEIERI
jgi:hypothetical protein